MQQSEKTPVIQMPVVRGSATSPCTLYHMWSASNSHCYGADYCDPSSRYRYALPVVVVVGHLAVLSEGDFCTLAEQGGGSSITFAPPIPEYCSSLVKVILELGWNLVLGRRTTLCTII